MKFATAASFSLVSSGFSSSKYCLIYINKTRTEKSVSNSETSSGGGSWWGGWLQAAKDKSMSAIEMIKKDLEEFSNTMSHDTGEAVAKTSESLRETLRTENTEAAKDRLKQGLSSFLEGLTKLLVVEAEDKNVAVEKRKTTDPIFDRAKARLHAIQVDPSTYCSNPSGPREKYEEWLKSFDMNTKKGEVSELLVSQVEVRGLYTRLVPSEISHADFWRRYFYKVNQLQIDEARKLALMKRAEQSEKKEESINWDDEDSSSDDVEIKKSSPPKSKTEANILPNIPKNTMVTVEQHGLSLPKTDTNTKVNTTSDISPITATDAKTASDSDIEHKLGNKETSNTNTDSQQTLDLPHDDNVDSVKTCMIHENDIKESFNSLHMEEKHKDDHSETENSQCEKLTKEPSIKSDDNDNMEKHSGKSDKTEVEETVESETDTVKSLCSNEETTGGDDIGEIRTKEKGDVVVVNPDRDSPSTESTKGSADDDWERDFDVELTEEDLKAADEIAKKLNLSSTDYTKLSAEMDDWESWE